MPASTDVERGDNATTRGSVFTTACSNMYAAAYLAASGSQIARYILGKTYAAPASESSCRQI